MKYVGFRIKKTRQNTFWREKMETLYIVMPAYNEEENIKTVVEQWYPILEGKSDASRLVIADSGSKDKTHDILMKLKKKIRSQCMEIGKLFMY